MTYWKDRIEKQKEILLGKSIDELNYHLATVYKSSMRDVDRDIKGLYYELIAQSDNGKVTINDLYRYNRYWEVRNDINKRLTQLGQAQIDMMDKDLTKMYIEVQDYFNKNPKFWARSSISSSGKVQKITGLSMRPVDLNSPIVSEKAKEVVNSVWCADGLYWNQRVWKNMELLQQSLEQGLTDTIVRGISPQNAMIQIAQEQQLEGESWESAFSRSERLVRTEMSHVYNAAAVERYKDAGCIGYEWLTARDERVCADCAELDGQFFPFGNEEDMPPLHPNCLCTVIPVLGGK